MLSETPSQRVVLKIVVVLTFMSSNWILLGQGVALPSYNYDEEVGINIDRFIGSPFQSDPEVSHCSIIKRDGLSVATHGPRGFRFAQVVVS